MALPERFKAVGLVDIVPEAFNEALGITGLSRSACFTSLTEAMAATPCDAVGVFTPGHLHTSYMEEAIAAGKHVIVEKPFTCSLEEAQRVVAAAEANDVQVVVTQNDRFFHPYPLLREIIADRRYGELGAITMVHHNARGRPFENGYPPMHLWHQGSHQVDSLLSLVQRPPRCVWGVNATPASSNWTAEPHVCAIITFDGPVIVSYTATSDAQAYEMYLRLEFSEAAVTLHGFSLNSTDFRMTVTPRQPLERYPRSEVFPIDGPSAAAVGPISNRTSGTASGRTSWKAGTTRAPDAITWTRSGSWTPSSARVPSGSPSSCDVGASAQGGSDG